ncbi:DUF362 domain-containing protein [Heliobacterium gestii]|uniref:DUF362 domain-containing protein n=1 Tax=Heliomicrobium gestii TaxID=2699 RepID=A0A845LCM9_HELGE|nr:DUF362 domain-containing protein [Heliomicrobium gestii]MBM7867504.1 putative Fe-S center protein [Heliomicrobium gestii]MZP43948.1 DUF362 domain-containing protein [Heliomicrobium gestii]
MAKVYFVSPRAKAGKGLVDKLRRLIKAAGTVDGVEKGELVAIKMHFGERGNTATIRPPFVGAVVDEVRRKEARPFLTDSNTLYRGSRSNAVDHMDTAMENGYSYATVKAPVIIADGLNGKEYRNVPIEGKRLKEAKIAAIPLDADGMIVLSHFKGHEMTGFGGAIKNLAMGLASRSGKLVQHQDVKPEVNDKCKVCGKCVHWCPVDAISLGERAVIAGERCIGCGECTVTCPHKAIAVNWNTDVGLLQEKMAEYAYAAVKEKREKGKVTFINFVLDVSPECDCCSWSDAPIVPDIGILASDDPVALDQACYDLVNQAPGLRDGRLGDAGQGEPHAGVDKFRIVHPSVDGAIQLRHAEEMGLGSRTYELVRLGE